MNRYKDTINTFFHGWDINCNINNLTNFDAFTLLLDTYPPQYAKYAGRKLIDEDPTGEWCYYFACKVTGADVPQLQAAIIDKDPTGWWCYRFARNIDEANVALLQQAVIEKDTTGESCYYFARDVTGADVPQLQQAVIDKGSTGEWCYRFARNVAGADVPPLQAAVIDKDPTGEWCYLFASEVKGADISLLQQAVVEKDLTGEYLAKWIQNQDSTSLPDIVEGLFNQDKPVPPLLVKEYPESLELYKKLQMDAYKDTIDAFFDGWETNCNIDSFDTLVRLLNTYPPQYINYAEKELVKKDPTGRWYIRFARDVTGADVPLLQQAVVDKDPTGEWCYLFARDVTGADVPQLQHAVIEKNQTGEWCYQFAKDVKGADISLLQQATVEKDTTGWWCCYFASKIEGADVTPLQQVVLEKDTTGELCYKLARHISVEGIDVSRLQQAIIERDPTGEFCYRLAGLAPFIKEIDIPRLQQAVIDKDPTGEWCFEFARDIKGADLSALRREVIKKDKTGRLCACAYFACYALGKNDNDGALTELKQAVIDKDPTGEWCYKLARKKSRNLKHEDFIDLQEAVIEKNIDGVWCCEFANDIKEVDICAFKKSILEKDRTGRQCYYVAKSCRLLTQHDIVLFRQAVINKDPTGEWCYKFARDVKGAAIFPLQKAVIEKNTGGKWCYEFCLLPIRDREPLIQSILETGQTQWAYHLLPYTSTSHLDTKAILRTPEEIQRNMFLYESISDEDKSRLINHIIKYDVTGQDTYNVICEKHLLTLQEALDTYKKTKRNIPSYIANNIQKIQEIEKKRAEEFSPLSCKKKIDGILNLFTQEYVESQRKQKKGEHMITICCPYTQRVRQETTRAYNTSVNFMFFMQELELYPAKHIRYMIKQTLALAEKKQISKRTAQKICTCIAPFLLNTDIKVPEYNIREEKSQKQPEEESKDMLMEEPIL